MQTDSHMDVVKDWDHKMLQMWGRVNNEYGILTTYVHKIEQVLAGAENKNDVPHLCQVRRNPQPVRRCPSPVPYPGWRLAAAAAPRYPRGIHHRS